MESDSRVHQFPTVSQYMTVTPHTIARNQSLSVARQLMRQFDIRHLPVLDNQTVVGLLSERDLFLVESLPGANPTDVRAEEAMTAEVFTVTRDAPVGQVIGVMITRKIGSAVVIEEGRAIGLFTTIDALRALQDRLQQEP